jgi:NTE family protein
MVSENVRRGLILGCGGTLGAAWSIAALAEVSRALSWDPRVAEVIVGTSAGAELAMLLASGTSAEELLQAQLGSSRADPLLARRFASPPRSLPALPAPRPTSLRLALRAWRHPLTAAAALAPIGRGDPSFLDAFVDARVGAPWVPHPRTWIVAVDLASGERVAFGSPGAPPATIAEAVRASWAIPGFYPPAVVGGRRYADGGIASPASADLALPLRLDEAIVLAPMASSEPWRPKGLSRIEALLRTSMRRILDAEVAKLRAAGTRVVRLEPGADDLAAMGANFMDGKRRLRVLESSLRTSRRTVRAALEQGGVA